MLQSTVYVRLPIFRGTDRSVPSARKSDYRKKKKRNRKTDAFLALRSESKNRRTALAESRVSAQTYYATYTQYVGMDSARSYTAHNNRPRVYAVSIYVYRPESDGKILLR